jgi:hypothetical protein
LAGRWFGELTGGLNTEFTDLAVQLAVPTAIRFTLVAIQVAKFTGKAIRIGQATGKTGVIIGTEFT